MTDPGIEVASLRPFMHVTCDAIYYIAKDDTGVYVDVDKEPEALLLVCDLKFTPNTTSGMILVGDTLQLGAVPDYFEFKNVGDPAGSYPWPVDIQLLNLDDVDLNPRGANYTIELTPVGYVGSSGVVTLLNWETQTGVIPCVAGTNSVPLLQWLPLASTNNGKPALLGPKGDTGKSAYDIAVINGFVGTEAEWSASLTNAAQSFANAASGSADAALGSKNAAAISATNADQSAGASAISADQALVSKNAAAGSESNSSASASQAAASLGGLRIFLASNYV